MKDKELVSSDAIECHGVIGLDAGLDPEESDYCEFPITLDLLEYKRGLLKVLKPTPASIQHFRDGTTRVLCPHLQYGDDVLICVKSYALTDKDDRQELHAAIPKRLQLSRVNPEQEVKKVLQETPCPYRVTSGRNEHK